MIERVRPGSEEKLHLATSQLQHGELDVLYRSVGGHTGAPWWRTRCGVTVSRSGPDEVFRRPRR